MIDRKPFDGAITRYFEDDAPEAIRAALKTAKTFDILDPTCPYAARMENSLYMAEMTALQIELAKFHAWVCDAAGKGGTRPFLPKPHGSRICCLRMGSA